MRQLRPYQRDAVTAVQEAWRGGMLRPAVVMPTGTGKSTVLGQLAMDRVNVGQRVLILAHRGELLDQIGHTLVELGLPRGWLGRVQAERNDVTGPITLATVQTLARPGRLSWLDPYDLVIRDEAHHSASDTDRLILATMGCFAETPAAGFTATLQRGDRRSLGDIWDGVAVHHTIRWAINEGHLVEPHGRAVVLPKLDLDDVTYRAGDYADGELDDMVLASADVIAAAYVKHAYDRRSIVFTPGVESTHAVCTALRNIGVSAAAVVGSTPRASREDVYARLRSGELSAVVNCMVLTEGFDLPDLDCAVMARPTAMAHLYTQMAGRVLRPAPGKTDALILDMVGVARKHALTTLIDLYPKLSYRVPDELKEAQGELEATFNSRRTLIGPQKFEDIDLFARSRMTWLFTRAGTRFVPAGDRVVVLWQNPDETYRVGHIHTRRPRDNEWVVNGLPLDEARLEGEQLADELGDTLSRRTSSWRRGGKPSDAQVAFAASLGIKTPDIYNKPRLSDEISIVLASRLLDRKRVRT